MSFVDICLRRATLASLVVVVASGCVLAMGGRGLVARLVAGHFFNSIHLWSVEMTFGFMVVHLWGKVLDGGLARQARPDMDHRCHAVRYLDRDLVHRFLSQSNLDSQWIGGQAKDGLNSIGAGAFFNVLNPDRC